MKIEPYLFLEGRAEEAIEFYKKAIGAKVNMMMRFKENPDAAACPNPPGMENKIMHASLKIGDSNVMIGEGGGQSPLMPAQIYLYVDDCDRYYKQALAAGATSVREPADQFYGDRNATVKDNFGNVWSVGTHIEDVSAAEMDKRMKAMMGKPA